MMLRNIVLFAATLSVVSATAVRAHAATTVITYDAIDSYQSSGGSSFTITGLVHGASASSTVRYNTQGVAIASACERQLIIAINRPGRFSVTLETVWGDDAIANCTLTRRN